MKVRWDLVLLPPLVISLVLLIASQFVFLKGSLQRDVGMGVLAPGLTLENFREIFTDPYFVSSLWLSFSVSTVAMVITDRLSRGLRDRSHARAAVDRAARGGGRVLVPEHRGQGFGPIVDLLEQRPAQ
jgi:hypothetical protein